MLTCADMRFELNRINRSCTWLHRGCSIVIKKIHELLNLFLKETNMRESFSWIRRTSTKNMLNRSLPWIHSADGFGFCKLKIQRKTYKPVALCLNVPWLTTTCPGLPQWKQTRSLLPFLIATALDSVKDWVSSKIDLFISSLNTIL